MVSDPSAQAVVVGTAVTGGVAEPNMTGLAPLASAGGAISRPIHEAPLERSAAPSVSGRDTSPPTFRALFDAHVAYVAATLARLGVRESERDDLVSEVFVRVHRELAAYDPSRPIRPWLFAFAARVASDHRRLARHRREVVGEPVDSPSTEPPPDHGLEHRDARRTVERALAAIDIEKREVFVLHHLDDIPVPEIARALGIPEGTAYSRLRAARVELAAAVRREQMRSGGGDVRG